MVKDVADEPKYLCRRFLIKYLKSPYFGYKYSISETPSVTGERDKPFLIETSVAYNGFNTMFMWCTMSAFCWNLSYTSNVWKKCKILRVTFIIMGVKPASDVLS